MERLKYEQMLAWETMQKQLNKKKKKLAAERVAQPVLTERKTTKSKITAMAVDGPTDFAEAAPTQSKKRKADNPPMTRPGRPVKKRSTSKLASESVPPRKRAVKVTHSVGTEPGVDAQSTGSSVDIATTKHTVEDMKCGSACNSAGNKKGRPAAAVFQTRVWSKCSQCTRKHWSNTECPNLLTAEEDRDSTVADGISVSPAKAIPMIASEKRWSGHTTSGLLQSLKARLCTSFPATVGSDRPQARAAASDPAPVITSVTAVPRPGRSNPIIVAGMPSIPLQFEDDEEQTPAATFWPSTAVSTSTSAGESKKKNQCPLFL